MRLRSSWKFGLSVFLLGIGVFGCASRRQEATRVAVPIVDTPVPTVAPSTPTPTPPPTPLPTRPVGREEVKPRKGQAVGPVITHFGAARADGIPVTPVATEKGIPTYLTGAGAGFILVVEAKPGLAGHEVGRRVFAHVPDDPTVRPDLEIISNRPLGNGDPRVCDSRRPDIGGIPAAPSFAETQAITDAINDFACRFETHNDNESACTVNASGDFAFVNPETTQQFCMAVARAWEFPVGDTILTVRVRDVKGNPGPPKKLRIRRPAQPPSPRPGSVPSPTPAGPKPLPTRPE
ncbi:hypothetical protein HRbin30_02339 [bacterium HR30]|nr:hypothetical protein HRbin30_02339 [bacterium HR30]